MGTTSTVLREMGGSMGMASTSYWVAAMRLERMEIPKFPSTIPRMASTWSHSKAMLGRRPHWRKDSRMMALRP